MDANYLLLSLIPMYVHESMNYGQGYHTWYEGTR